ncbi:DUF899 domain-containing protein [Brevifollis gellanilyticus]|uniref:Thioredoxin n=1 Tax=Brevifollis gellanilyticus TaxID=748831 RepID=A0A512MEZ1_9BACT|nr:thioredoxin family protein [Brevifollis gellanilyticus]GEP45309.1 hypothetical protein BGE01nite_46000 [Brevifollis gellanilyticus]
MKPHSVVSQEEWQNAAKALLAKEKEHSRKGDEIARQRRELPWVKITQNYVFESTEGKVSLADLFDGRSQLFVYHFMFGPDWEEGCTGCSFLCDHVDGARQHFEHHDLSFVAVSRGPLEKLQEYRKRMGWKFRWVSSANTDFNYDFNVSFPAERVKDGKITYNLETIDAGEDTEELPGMSIFYKDENGEVYHTYSSFGRGGEAILGAYSFIDMTPKGRQENKNGNLMDWVKRHDRYEDDGRHAAKSCCGCNSESKAA